jgi:protein disulfide-isomerase A1
VFYPADKAAKPVTYDGGDRSLKAMTKFIKKHAKVAYELPKKDKADKDAGDDDTKAKDDKAEEEEEVKDEL